MALVDDVRITVKAGNGGNGGTAKKQLFGSKKTAPDGGNGGNGGNIYFKGDANISDLSQFQFKKKIVAANGVNGLNKDLDGANGEHTYVLVPFGTTVTDEATGDFVEILTDQPFCVATGGHGGMGNHDYKPDLDRLTPRHFEGGIGDERKLHLVLNMIADVGLVGLPNAGKSSLLKALTNAVPKVGAYPFTTLEPNLGAMGKIIIADIPGLIEGASGGKGLGIQFLKHIKKTKILLHCIASDEKDVATTYRTVREEFAGFDKILLEKNEVIVLTKKDLTTEKELLQKIEILKKINPQIITASIYEPESLEIVREKIISASEVL
ncbi:MAG: Obg family GTPase CgtA [Candidatus Levybacteria bacterium]|nr:Obg family GTPase CgtA [Candidatus Levybacteria bacterium]